MINNEGHPLNFSHKELAQLHTELIKAVLWYQDTKSTKGHHALFTDKNGIPHVDVLATLTSDTVKVPGLVIRSRVGQYVTGHIAINDIINVHNHPDVKELEGARILYPVLSDSVEDVNASVAQLKLAPEEALRDPNDDHWYLDGSGVIVGGVDNFIDFTSKNFRKDNGSSRILNIWKQNGFSLNPDFAAPEPFGYGNEYNRQQINNVLSDQLLHTRERMFEAFDIYDSRFASRHGSFVTDIIAGGGYHTNEPGIAFNADIIFVDFAIANADEEALSNSSRMLDAVNYIFTKANEYQRPAVVNISQNSNGGPHDGTDIIDQAFDALLTHNRAIVIAAGNSGDKHIHTQQVLDVDQSVTIHWDTTTGAIMEMELWYDNITNLVCTITPPDGVFPDIIVDDQSNNFPPDNMTTIRNADGADIGKVIARTLRGMSKTFDIILTLGSAPRGKWTITLRNIGPEKVTVDGWIERGFADLQGTFDEADENYSLGSISCGRKTIVVAAYDHTMPDKPISMFSSRGPTRDGRRKPDICAPGENIFALGWKDNDLSGPDQGTSFSAPHVAGIVAVLMQAAHFDISSAALKTALLCGAQRYPDDMRDFYSQGQGRANALYAVETLFL